MTLAKSVRARDDQSPARGVSGVSVSRRKAMDVIVSSATFASGVVRGLPASATHGGEDPIVELIERHRRARRALDTILKKKSKAEEKFRQRTGHASPTVECAVALKKLYISYGGQTLEEFVACKRVIPARIAKENARSHEKIDELLGSDHPEQARALHAEFDQQQDLYDTIVAPHDVFEQDGLDIVRELEDELLAATPKSLVGLQALLRYAKEAWCSKQQEIRLLDVAARSVSALIRTAVRS
jgi:hypothetical protein